MNVARELGKTFFVLILMITSASTLALWGASANAENNSQANIGMLFGYGVPDANDTSARQIWGFRGSSHLTHTLSLGGYYILSGRQDGSGGRKFNYSIHGIEGDYRSASANGETFFGLRLGLSKVRTEQSSQDLIFSPYHYGVVMGHNYFLTSWLAFGFEGSYIQFNGSNTIVDGVRYKEDRFNAISFTMSLDILL